MNSRIHQFLPECIVFNYHSATNNTRTSRTSFFACRKDCLREDCLFVHLDLVFHKSADECALFIAGTSVFLRYQVKLVLVDIWQMNNHIFPQVSASDPDLGPSGTVRFSLVPDSNDHYKSFTIDPLNGTIYTSARFDREELSLYKITVRATDQPTSGQAR